MDEYSPEFMDFMNNFANGQGSEPMSSEKMKLAQKLAIKSKEDYAKTIAAIQAQSQARQAQYERQAQTPNEPDLTGLAMFSDRFAGSHFTPDYKPPTEGAEQRKTGQAGRQEEALLQAKLMLGQADKASETDKAVIQGLLKGSTKGGASGFRAANQANAVVKDFKELTKQASDRVNAYGELQDLMAHGKANSVGSIRRILVRLAGDNRISNADAELILPTTAKEKYNAVKNFVGMNVEDIPLTPPQISEINTRIQDAKSQATKAIEEGKNEIASRIDQTAPDVANKKELVNSLGKQKSALINAPKIEKVKVTNGSETYEIDPSHLKDAAKDGYHPVEVKVAR